MHDMRSFSSSVSSDEPENNLKWVESGVLIGLQFSTPKR
jgi:hypothetical protein